MIKIFIIFLLVTNISNSYALEAESKLVRISGSTSLYPALLAIAELFKKLNPGSQLEVKQSSSGEGIKSFIAGDIDIAASSRPVQELEYNQVLKVGTKIEMYSVADDAIAIIINPKLKQIIKDISTEQLKNIFLTGSYKTWSAVNPKLNGAIHVYIRSENSSGTAEEFLDKLNAENKTSNLRFIPNAFPATSTESLLSSVESDPYAISFISISSIKNKNIFILPVKSNKSPVAVAISSNGIRNKNYPFSRKLYLIGDPESSMSVAKFLDFTVGPLGQKIMVQQGLLPIR